MGRPPFKKSEVSVIGLPSEGRSRPKKARSFSSHRGSSYIDVTFEPSDVGGPDWTLVSKVYDNGTEPRRRPLVLHRKNYDGTETFVLPQRDGPPSKNPTHWLTQRKIGVDADASGDRSSAVVRRMGSEDDEDEDEDADPAARSSSSGVLHYLSDSVGQCLRGFPTTITSVVQDQAAEIVAANAPQIFAASSVALAGLGHHALSFASQYPLTIAGAALAAYSLYLYAASASGKRSTSSKAVGEKQKIMVSSARDADSIDGQEVSTCDSCANDGDDDESWGPDGCRVTEVEDDNNSGESVHAPVIMVQDPRADKWYRRRVNIPGQKEKEEALAGALESGIAAAA